MPKKNFFADDYGVQISAGIKRPIYSVDEQIDLYETPTPEPTPIYTNPKFFYQMPIEQPAYPVYSAPVFSPAPVDEVLPINPKFYYQMPEYPIEQPAYPVYSAPVFFPAPVDEVLPIEQPAYPMQPILPTLEGGIDFGTPIAYEVPKFDVEPPTLYTPLPDYPIEQPAYTVMPTPDFPIKTVEPVSPIDEFIPPITDVPPFSDDTETGGGVVKTDVEPVKQTKPTLPETKPVSKNLTPYVYSGLGIVVILLVARMVTKKD